MLALAAALAPVLDVVRFDFPYREKGSRVPDRMPVLMEAIRARAAPGCILGGRSMGGRAAHLARIGVPSCASTARATPCATGS
jgi:predicted alpha/beta-hydrolase family hydrolase